MKGGFGFFGVFAACLALSGEASADPQGPVPPSEVRGISREAREPGHAYRALAHGALWLPRSIAELVLFTTGEVAGIVENEQFVPRAREILGPRDAIAFFPTFFLETGTAFNVGARMIANIGNVATSLRVGYGGADTNVAESRLRFGITSPVFAVLSLEGLHDERTGLAYLGVGQRPFEDARNRYRGEPRPGIFRESRERIIGSFGIRPQANTELFFSTSLTQRRTDDAPGSAPNSLSSVFQRQSLPGAFETTRVAYTEVAFRYDSRPSRKAVATGALIETYAGLAQEVASGDSQFSRTGLRAAGFFPVYRHSNILSPRIVLDGLTQISGSPVPFRELTGQPSFRGSNDRRDDVSLVLSLDYRWSISRYIAARLFVDGATVAPSLARLDLTSLRPAWGFGLDLHSEDAVLGQIALAMSPEGASFLFSFGAAAGFGDRQHRD